MHGLSFVGFLFEESKPLLYFVFGMNTVNDFSNRWCKRENVEPDVLKEWKINIFKELILIFQFTLVILIFYPLNLNLLFVILNEVSRIFICTMFAFQQIKLLTML